MSYSDLLNEETDEQFLCVLKPKKQIKTWTNVSGFEWKSTFDLSRFITVKGNGTALTLASASTPLSAGEYFYDPDIDNQIFLRMPDSSDPNSQVIVVEYELFLATTDSYLGRDPTDSTTETVHFEGFIGTSPSIKQSMTDSLVGYLPTDTSRIQFLNGERFFEQHFDEVSYKKAEITIYHALREKQTSKNISDFEPENIQKIIDGVCGNVFYREDTISIEIVSRLDSFDVEYRNTDSNNFYSSSTFSNLDPSFEGSAIRYVYGVVDGFVPVNIDFVDDSPTTSDNRDWVCVGEQTGLPNVAATVVAGSTTTTTNLDDATGFKVGDFVWIDKTIDEYREVTAVDYGANTISHAALSSGAAAAADTVTRYWVARVEIEQNGVRYQAFPNRDYTVGTFSGTTSGFSFTTSMESNISLPSTLSPGDSVFVRVYGKTNDVTVDVGAGPVALGADDSDLGNLTNPITILYDLLANNLGIDPSKFELTDFQSLATAQAGQRVGLAIPHSSTDSFPTYKELLNEFIQTLLFRFYLSVNDKWTAKILAPLSTSDDDVTNDEIFEGSFQYEFDYKDLASDFQVNYAHREVPATVNGSDLHSVVTAVNNVAKYLHEVEKKETVESLHIDSTDAQDLVDHRSYIFGDRMGQIKYDSKDNKYFDTLISDVQSVKRVAMPGFSFDEDTTRQVDSAVIQINKGLRTISIVLDDQKGIEDNSSSW